MRAIINLTKTQKDDLTKRKKSESNNKIYRRYLYLEMSSTGMTNLNIAKILGVRNDTLTVWKKIYEKSGIKGLAELNYDGRRVSKLEEYKDILLKKIKEDNISTLKQLQSFLNIEHHIKIEQSWLYRFCKKNSIYLTKRHV